VPLRQNETKTVRVLFSLCVASPDLPAMGGAKSDVTTASSSLLAGRCEPCSCQHLPRPFLQLSGHRDWKASPLQCSPARRIRQWSCDKGGDEVSWFLVVYWIVMRAYGGYTCLIRGTIYEGPCPRCQGLICRCLWSNLVCLSVCGVVQGRKEELARCLRQRDAIHHRVHGVCCHCLWSGDHHCSHDCCR
jgi:hypothetical protein